MNDQTSDVGVREAILTALKGVVKHAGQSLGTVVRERVYMLLMDLIHSEDDQLRISSSTIFGRFSLVSSVWSRFGNSYITHVNFIHFRAWISPAWPTAYIDWYSNNAVLLELSPSFLFYFIFFLSFLFSIFYAFLLWLSNINIAVLGRYSNLWSTKGSP